MLQRSSTSPDWGMHAQHVALGNPYHVHAAICVRTIHVRAIDSTSEHTMISEDINFRVRPYVSEHIHTTHQGILSRSKQQQYKVEMVGNAVYTIVEFYSLLSSKQRNRP